MRMVLILSFLVFVSSGYGQSVDGFKGYAWGTSYKAMEDEFKLQPWPLKNWGKNTIVATASEKVQMGSVEIEAASFWFYKDQFYKIDMYIETEDFTRLVLESWSKAYGKRPNLYKHMVGPTRTESYAWPNIGKDSQSHYTIYHDMDIFKTIGHLFYSCKSIDSLMQRDFKEAGKW